MFRKKFIDRLRSKYQSGGYKNTLTEPYITAGGRTINTEAGNRTGFGGRISVPILESIRHGESSTGLRGEIDAYANTGNQNLRGDLEATTDIGTMPDDMPTAPNVSNRSLGLRGYYNKNLGRRNNLSLKTNVGMGVGTGEKRGEYIYKDSDTFGGYDRSEAEGNELASYADANVSLLRRMGQRQGIPGEVGLKASYGTNNAPNPGLRLGLEGSTGPLTGGVDYDFTNKAPRFNVGLKFQDGGWSKLGSFASKALKYIPTISRSMGSKLLGPTGLVLGSNKAYAPPVTDIKTGVNRFTGKQEYTPFGQTPSWGGGSRNVNVADVNKDLSAAMAPNINQTGGMYEEMKQYQEGGKKKNTRFNVSGTEMEFADKQGNPISPAGSSIRGDIQRIFTDRSADNLSSSDTLYYNQRSGALDYYDPESGERSNIVSETEKEYPFGQRQVNAPYLGTMKGKFISTPETFEAGKTRKQQTGGMYNQMQQYQEGGKYPHDMYNKKTGYKIVAEDAEAHSALSKDFDHNKMMGGGMYDQMQQYQQGGEHTMPDGTVHPGATHEEYMAMMDQGQMQQYKGGGMYEQMKQYQMGGQQLPGGTMEPIPGSDAVVFKGATHDQGGINPDPQTEVEGGGFAPDGTPLEGETMDKVTMAKKGGLKDYFFSDYLKLGGRKFSDIHKDILQKGGTQEDIDWLAVMQEKKAGRNPNQIAKYGGVDNYQSGGYYLGQDVPNPASYLVPTEENKELFGADAYANPYDILNQPNVNLTTLEEQAKKDEAARLANLNVSGDRDPLTVGTPAEVEYAKLNAKVIEAEATGDKKEKNKLLKRLKNAMKDTPTGAYIAGAAQLLPAAHAWFSKQPDAEQVAFTSGVTSPIVAERGKASDLERVDYNQDIANIGSDIRGMNKFIETSGGGPSNIINKMVAFSKGRRAKDKVRAAETRANIDISNREAQMEQQMTLSNLQRSQQAAITNAQLARAEAAREDQIEIVNAAARQKLKDDKAAMKGRAVASFAQGITGIIGDVISYKAAERIARTIGSEGIYDRDKIYGELIKQGVEPEIAKKKATELYNARMELSNLKTT